uniref:Ammonium_transp domain-containing protein n=1 Tax=Steinernema glaseri TaxID=37863 RepID=A0A1I7YV76_9BILA
MNSALQRRQFALVATVFQVLFGVLYAVFCRYNTNAMPFGSASRVYVNTDYPLFQDIHVMVFVGFGFLMAFLKRYGFSAVTVNLMLSAFITQWATLLRGFLTQEFIESGKFTISINQLMRADMSCVVVLISMGVLLGKLTPVQFIILAFVETSLSILAEHIIFNILHVNDGGRSLVIHTFGAYFGLAVALVGHKTNVMETDSDGSIDHSDLFSMIGTLFLWIFFPSFNAAVQQPEDARHRAIMNSYIAMSSCTMVTFIVSSLADNLGRFNMLHIQSSTLAGGIAMGSVANVVLYPYHAVVVGAIAGLISVVGHVYITPKLLETKLGIFDTCGVHNLHGLPGLLSGIFSIYFVLHYEPAEYGRSVHTFYPYFAGGDLGGDRDAYSQALYQLAGIGVTLVTAITGGMITGAILRMNIWNQMDDPLNSYDTNFYGKSEFNFLNRFTEEDEVDGSDKRNSRLVVY